MGTIVLLILVWIAVGVLVFTQRLRRFVSLSMSLLGLAVSLTLTLALLLIVESRQRASIVRQMEKRGETIAAHLAAPCPVFHHGHYRLPRGSHGQG